jgi:hypothetical protein
MNNATFDALSRRASLVTLGAAGLAALADPVVADAKNTAKKKARKKCQQQVGQCTAFLAEQCDGDPSCLAVTACCPSLGNCDVAAFFACLT